MIWEIIYGTFMYLLGYLFCRITMKRPEERPHQMHHELEHMPMGMMTYPIACQVCRFRAYKFTETGYNPRCSDCLCEIESGFEADEEILKAMADAHWKAQSQEVESNV